MHECIQLFLYNGFISVDLSITHNLLSFHFMHEISCFTKRRSALNDIPMYEMTFPLFLTT